ncbi:DUF4190 domain-containing protein [Arthrobacter sp. efr-133-TYG-118]|uniref:DUF4190 domain-containing protein n=1 Tax=Arthrobacter sp. efr-133-TYG-118 TaxID=3040279 RepID=UPI00254BAE11|nr:DUF4190 domain-containing protein [Arthrobacter sp. efr-133-TYG-118]
MTDQPAKPENTPEGDEPPKGYEPPSYIPPAPQPGENPYGEQPFASPAASGPYGQPQAQQPQEPYGQPQGAPAQFGQPAYGQQPASPYGQPASPYGQPPQGPPAYGQPTSPYGQPAYYGMPVEPKGLSIASMCCGIAVFVGLGFFVLPQIAAVILGHMALKKEPAGKGMAIAGLVMGYLGIVGVIIFWVFIAIFAATASRYNYNY